MEPPGSGPAEPQTLDLSDEELGPEEGLLVAFELGELIQPEHDITRALEKLELPIPVEDELQLTTQLDVLLDESEYAALLHIARSRGVPLDTVLQDAISRAKVLEQVAQEGGRGLLLEPSGETRSLSFGDEGDADLLKDNDTQRILGYLAEPHSDSILAVAAALGIEPDRTQRVLRWLDRVGLVGSTSSPVKLYGGIFYLTESGLRTARQLGVLPKR